MRDKGDSLKRLVNGRAPAETEQQTVLRGRAIEERQARAKTQPPGSPDQRKSTLVYAAAAAIARRLGASHAVAILNEHYIILQRIGC